MTQGGTVAHADGAQVAPPGPPRLADRMAHIAPFYVMELAKAAQALAASPACDPTAGGEPMVFLNIGEPEFTAAPAVVAAAQRCLQRGDTQYTNALGLQALRDALSAWYASHHQLAVPAQRIVVTAGASAALQLVCLTLFGPGDEVLMPDPSYPCNRHFVAAAGAQARLLPAPAAQRHQLSAQQVAQAWQARTRAVLLASPSNPTGTSLTPQAMAQIVAAVRQRGGVTLVDEIYQGLCFDATYSRSALALGEDVISINSFSKYFGMTGWRLGWAVLPSELVPAVERLAQNLFICPSTLAQHAALACFEPASLAEFERRREVLHRRRDKVVRGLASIGLPVSVEPDGAFYAWLDCRSSGLGSWDFCQHMLHRAHVALTPGRDFGQAAAASGVRLSFAGADGAVDEALFRLGREMQRLRSGPGQ